MVTFTDFVELISFYSFARTVQTFGLDDIQESMFTKNTRNNVMAIEQVSFYRSLIVVMNRM